MLPKGFVTLEDKRIILSMAYVGTHNFTGRRIDGYNASLCILTEAASNALSAVQDELDSYKKNYRLKIFDGYRPARACADFKLWAMDENDQATKDVYFPTLTKPELFEQGYIAEKSGHSRGSTVDLTITRAGAPNTTYEDLDMGTPFDFFGEESHTAFSHISEVAQKNRLLLKNVMEKNGFENYHKEWWHFTLKNEPFPDTYFDFPVDP